MPLQYISLILVRLVLPTALLLSIALRPFGFSIIYLLLYLLLSLVQLPTSKTFKGFRGNVLLVTVLASWLLLLVHLVWHIVLLSFPPYGSILEKEGLITKIGYNLGLVSYNEIDPLMAVHYLAPELIMAGSSLVVYISLKKILMHPNIDEKLSPANSNQQQYPFLTSAGKYICLFLIMFSGIMRPSIISGIYFLVFMGAATAWAVGKPLEKGFAIVGRCLMAIMAVHVTVVIVYQCTWIISILPPENEFARYFGLTKLVKIDPDNPNHFTYVAVEDHMWATLGSPLIILFTYYILALETRELFKPKVACPYVDSKRLPYRGDPTETTPLMRGISPNKRLASGRSSSVKPVHQDSTGSVVIVDEEMMNVHEEPTLMEEIVAAIIDFFQVLIRSSYIATSIIMMAWSIMFHSWLTFVFLMWANIVWLCQDQRSFMLKTSPILVCYAMMLLLAQYIYGMNLTEDELPSNIREVNLLQIGLGRAKGEPCVTLLIKSLFTCMFWVTLRQRVQEVKQRRQSAVVADMAAPLHVSVSAAASVIEEKEEGKSRLLNELGKWLRAACAKYWIYVVVIMLFVIGITGERMTIFRIIYMFLFLSFILMFQISWYWWRRLMYSFWITVIIYSMVNLILIYIYQFDNFPLTIEKYLLINVRLQHDLGLEPYHPADLFVKLLTPTLFLIMTIMQVHYFHKDFMILSDAKSTSTMKGLASSRPSQAGASTMKDDDVPPLPLEEDAPKSPSASSRKSITEADHSIEMSSMNAPDKSTGRSPNRKSSRSYAPTMTERPSTDFREWAFDKWKLIRSRIHTTVDFIFLYLEIHLIKIVFVSMMLLCVMNVCGMHVPIMLLAVPGLLFSSKKQRICVLIVSTLISTYFMAKMVYQIDYIKHSYFDVNCTMKMWKEENDTMNYTTYNNAEWLGFVKATRQRPLVVILKGYIGLIAIITFYSLVNYRQIRNRNSGLIGSNVEKILFKNVGRKEADSDLVTCVKYLVNYGFYKFGIEITLICLMGVIGSRMDLYALFYSVWLLVFVSLTRVQQTAVWPAFTGFVTVLLIIQYMLAVGFLPQLCVSYPWAGDDQQLKHIRTWLFLPYAESPPHASKLVFDYFLLLFCSRQVRVFRIEKIFRDNYQGGSNDENIGKDWETTSFVNPVPDFLSYVGTWLDVIKRMVFLGMLWVTLAIMFLTGTNRVNLFSIGYLIGSFIFLWQGTDFYLRPKDSILKWWSWLLRYNVCVVVIKALLQIPGCVFGNAMQENACWLVQLFGIGCVDKFAGGSIAKFLKMQYYKEAMCSVPQEDIGLAWDGVCFAFLILQQRLFHSYYFYRVIDESKATTILASRGADLIEELRQKQMDQQEEQEKKILEKIKVKMERIKANQKKVQGQLVKETSQHDRDDDDDDDEDEDEDDDEETQHGESDQVPLVRGDSDASKRGYHTPQSPASPRGYHTPASEESSPPSRAQTPPITTNVIPVPPPLPLPILPTPSVTQGPPSPSSALMTVSLDAYLEPRRISFGSPPSSELLPRTQSPEESYPVFSPPPLRRRHTVASPSILQRTSIISQSSRAEPNSHHTSSTSRRVYRPRPPTSHQKAIRSGDYYMFDEFDDTDINLQDEESSTDEDAPTKEMGFGKLLTSAIKTDVKNAISQRRASVPALKATKRASLPSYPHSYSHDVRRRASRAQTEPTHEKDVDIAISERSEKGYSEIEEYAPEPVQETWFDKIKRVLEIIWMFVDSVLVSMTRYLLKYSRDYRYVSKTLSIEKKILKEEEGFGIGVREGSQMIWEPLPEHIAPRRKLSEISVPEIRILAPSMERGLDDTPEPHRKQTGHLVAAQKDVSDDDTSEHESAFSLQSTSSKDVTLLEEQDDSMFRKGKSSLTHLGYALWYAIISHTDIVCYIMVFINQIQSATILSIPLPLMVFLWGTLTIPRPTKTFWVTLIAYTEVIVLLKSMFQFEILPWNQKAIPANMPFTAPRIIGIERKSNYALYDLLLLLIIFLHRFMLKSLGLWKESTPEVEVGDNEEYALQPEDTKKIIDGRGDEVAKKYMKLHDRSASDRNQEDLRHNGDLDHEIEHGIERTEPDENGAGPSKQPDDDHFNVTDEEEPIIAVTSTLEDPYPYYPHVIVLSVKRYLQPINQFFTRMLSPCSRVTADVYAYMFLCDFLNFLVVIFGFAAFGTHQGDGGVQAYLEENKVPIPFLVMLILQFALIVVDRALYLRKFILGKILFQYILILGVHIWMFFILPFITERTFNALLPPPMWYMLKCIYLLLSAYQIRCGYPRRIIGNFLCKGYNYVNMLCFRSFMAVPFVFELRTLMDWMWTDTSMTLMDWLKMEDVFANVFLLKCSRYVEDEFPSPRGVKKSSTVKYLLGGSVLAFVIAIIWFPLVFFAFGNSVGQPNPPTDVTVKIRIGPFLPVYQMSAQSHNIRLYSESDYTHLSNMYARDRTAQTFLSNYMYNDVAVIMLNPNSTMNWEISPPELERLENEAISNSTLAIRFTYVLTRLTNSAQNPPTIEETREVQLEAYLSNGQRNPERDTLLHLLAQNSTDNQWLNVSRLFPKFLKVFNKGTAKPAYQLMPPLRPGSTGDEDDRLYRNVQMRLEHTPSGAMYWRVREACEPQDPLLGIPLNNCDMLAMYTFNDKLFPETLNFISGSGIIGLYTTFVFLASRVLRGFFSGIYTKIMFDDLPNVDRVLQLCLDIYLVREALELALEEDLFAKLVFLYRSPETMIKWSRPKEDTDEQRALPPSR